MPRRQTSRQSPNLQPQLRVIPGTLSLYRVGDVITFDLNEAEFSVPIDEVETEGGKTILWVTATVGVYPNHVKRVERKGMSDRRKVQG